jgi:hypothetical protein
MDSSTGILPVPLLPIAYYHSAPVIVSYIGLVVVGGGGGVLWTFQLETYN